MLVSFFNYNIPLYIEKNPVEKLCKVLEVELKKYTPVGLKFVFEKIKFKALHYIQHISFVNAQGSAKIRLVCSKGHGGKVGPTPRNPGPPRPVGRSGPTGPSRPPGLPVPPVPQDFMDPRDPQDH